MAVLLLIGVPLGTAFVVGMMAGCMSMMLMMMGGLAGHHGPGRDRSDHLDHDNRR